MTPEIAAIILAAAVGLYRKIDWQKEDTAGWILRWCQSGIRPLLLKYPGLDAFNAPSGVEAVADLERQLLRVVPELVKVDARVKVADLEEFNAVLRKSSTWLCEDNLTADDPRAPALRAAGLIE